MHSRSQTIPPTCSTAKPQPNRNAGVLTRSGCAWRRTSGIYSGGGWPSERLRLRTAALRKIRAHREDSDGGEYRIVDQSPRTVHQGHRTLGVAAGSSRETAQSFSNPMEPSSNPTKLSFNLEESPANSTEPFFGTVESFLHVAKPFPQPTESLKNPLISP